MLIIKISGKKPTKEEYKKAEIALALSLVSLYPCCTCGWPVHDGYVCTTCGETNPQEELE